MNSPKKSINFIGLSRPLTFVSVALVLASWYLAVWGPQLNFGIDFAGGTEVLVSLPPQSVGQITDEELGAAAREMGLEAPEVVTFDFQEEEQRDRSGFFIRSKSQKSLFADQYDEIRNAVDFELGAAMLTWEGELFTAKGPLATSLSAALTPLAAGATEGAGAAAEPHSSRSSSSVVVSLTRAMTVCRGPRSHGWQGSTRAHQKRPKN